MNKITFTVNGENYSLDDKDDVYATCSLNYFLRDKLNLRGTKAMCHEGGCGACVVSVNMLHPLHRHKITLSVNSCLVAVLSCHGWDITTIEGVGSRHAGLHPIQSRLALFNGTQCGYCTPGWIMNMYSIYEGSDHHLSASEIENSFGGNMCRCTGYRPILDAFKSLSATPDPALVCKVKDLEDLAENVCRKTEPCPLKDWCFVESADNTPERIKITRNGRRWYKVYSVKDIFTVLDNEGYDSYRFVAGNTGKGVYERPVPNIHIDIASVAELASWRLAQNLEIGAGMTLTDLMSLFREQAATYEDFAYLGEFYKHLDLVAHVPVRNVATVGGNLALKNQHNDFPSDLFLMFVTVGSVITLVDRKMTTIDMGMKEFLTTNLKGKIILKVKVPPLSSKDLVRTYKIMPRAQNAHAIMNAGFMFKINSKNEIEQATITYGCISPKFMRATKTENVLKEKKLFTNETVQIALQSLYSELEPVENPPEPGILFRKQLALGLFYKCILSFCAETRIDPGNRSGGEQFVRPVSRASQTYDTDQSLWPLNKPIPKLEAALQCEGAKYSNDLPTQPREVFAAFVLAKVSTGVIDSFDTTEALKIPGVIAFFTAKDIPGKNSFTPKSVPWQEDDEEILCSKDVLFYGQPVAIIVGTTEKLANNAAHSVVVKYKTNNKKPIFTIREALKAPDFENRIRRESTIEPKEKGEDVTKVLKGIFEMKSQYHYTMEPQTCVVVPNEDSLDVYPSTQWPDHAHVAIAQCLNIPENKINVTVRRIGGAYGGKASRASQIAAACALVANKLQRATRLVMSIQTNMAVVGKRQDSLCDYEIGVNNDGVIQYLKASSYCDCGVAFNDTCAGLTATTMSNLYDTFRWRIEANSVLTDKASNTWCRAPGTTEGAAFSEFIMERIALAVKKDPIEVRLANIAEKNKEIKDMIQSFKLECDFESRQKEVDVFNSENNWKKRAIKLVPMCYPIDYSGNFGVTISVYHGDGTVAISHAGVEMGQGINTKVAQVCAHVLQIDLEKVSVQATNNFITPNAMASNGSITSESVCFSTIKACNILLERLKSIKDQIKNPSWEKVIATAYSKGYNLQCSYMMSELDQLKGYSVSGVTVAEVELDLLTASYQVLRVDILEDAGQSISPEVDVGQIEGAFIMGLGLWTSENLVYDNNTGRLLTDRTWTYKPPGAKDIPCDLRVHFKHNSLNPVGVLRSKATGEPALVMSVCVPLALHSAAMLARRQYGYQDDDWLDIEPPYTLENIMTAISPKIEKYTLKNTHN